MAIESSAPIPKLRGEKLGAARARLLADKWPASSALSEYEAFSRASAGNPRTPRPSTAQECVNDRTWVGNFFPPAIGFFHAEQSPPPLLPGISLFKDSRSVAC